MYSRCLLLANLCVVRPKTVNQNSTLCFQSVKMGTSESPAGEAIQLPHDTDRGRAHLIDEPIEEPVLNEREFQLLVDAMLASTLPVHRTALVAISTPVGPENYYFQLSASGVIGTPLEPESNEFSS